MPIVKDKQKNGPPKCGYWKCKQPFKRKTENQEYCRPSHKVAAWNLRKFEKAVSEEVQRQLAEHLSREKTGSGN